MVQVDFFMKIVHSWNRHYSSIAIWVKFSPKKKPDSFITYYGRRRRAQHMLQSTTYIVVYTESAMYHYSDNKHAFFWLILYSRRDLARARTRVRAHSMFYCKHWQQLTTAFSLSGHFNCRGLTLVKHRGLKNLRKSRFLTYRDATRQTLKVQHSITLRIMWVLQAIQLAELSNCSE